MKLQCLAAFTFVVGCAADIKRPPAPAPSIVAVFDPLASPAPQIPLPNDLAKTGGDGTHLNVPDGPTDSLAQIDFNHYLNTLDGFPSSTPGSFSFSGPIDPATLTVGTPTMNGSVLVFNRTGSLPLGPDDYTLTIGSDQKSITLTPTRRWTSGSEYVVVVFGGDDPKGVKGATGETVLAAPAFFFLRSERPVEGICGDGSTDDCACPAAVVAKGDPTDKTCHSVIVGLADEQARLLEGGRQQLQAGLDQLLTFAGNDNNGPRKKSNVVLMWNFTIASAPMAVFDPTRGDVPFPNDVLIDQMTGRVNVPIPAGDPQAPIKMGLNTLDGFSTTAPETLGIDSTPNADGVIDAATVLPQKSVVMLGVTATNGPQFSAAPVFVAGGTTFAGEIALTPLEPLESDQVRYAAVVSSAVKDKAGRSLVAPPVMALVRGKNPLIDADGHSTVNILDDASAQQLEVLRMAEAQLFDVLEMAYKLKREDIAAAWTFTTQSIVRPLLALNELPTKSAVSTNVTITHVSDAAELAAKASTLAFPSAHLGAVVFGTMTTRRAADATGVIAFDRDANGKFSVKSTGSAETVRFVLALPNTTGPWPVSIVQHGLDGWRGSMAPVIDSFAAAGWATILIDLPYHGARAVCTEDSQCVTTTAGSCNLMTGVCAGGLKMAAPSTDDPMACSLQPLSGDATDCRPLASGAAFVNTSNLFAARDNVRQYAVDGAQLVRVLQDSANANGLLQQIAPLAYDPTKLAFLGMSLGGITGTIFLSVAPQPLDVVLNVAGGHLIDIIASGSLATLLQPLLQAMNVTPDTAAYLQLAGTATWILDPADPIAVGSHLARAPLTSYLTGTQNAPKRVILQEAGMDTTIRPQFEAALAKEIIGSLDEAGHARGITTGGMLQSTYFPDASHGSLLSSMPSAAITQSEQAQAVTWISSAGATLVAP